MYKYILSIIFLIVVILCLFLQGLQCYNRGAAEHAESGPRCVWYVDLCDQWERRFDDSTWPLTGRGESKGYV